MASFGAHRLRPSSRHGCHVFRFLDLRVAIKSVSSDEAPGRCSMREAIDVDKVRALVLTFKWTRLFFYTPRRRCLFDSLVLTFFLSQYGIVPKVVFGVACASV